MKEGEKLRLLTAIGNLEIVERVHEADFEFIDEVDSLEALEDLVEMMPMDALILNRLIDDDGLSLIRICKKAARKNIKVVVITEDYHGFSEKKLISSLINEGVYAFLTFDEVTADAIENIVLNYPKEFNYNLFASGEANTRIEKVVESVFKEVITVYSPLSQGATTTAAHLAFALASTKNCRVCIVDYNPLKPSFKRIFDTSFDFTLTDVLDAAVRQNLTYERLEGFTKAYKLQTNLDILPGIYEINDYYASGREQYREVIEKLKFNYDYVIIDTHSWFDVYCTDTALKLADKVIVPMYGDRHSVDAVNRYIEAFKRYNDFDVRKFNFLINRFGGEDLTFVELEAKLQGRIIGYVSNHKALDKAFSFRDKRIQNEYIEILNAIGIKAAKHKRILDLFNRAYRVVKHK